VAPVWKIGELARRTGLTVRTLHHYDEIGLLSPAERSDGGHRVYDEAAVQRLYRIVSLRSLGFPLEAIARALDADDFDPAQAVDDHIRRLEAQIAEERRLLEKLRALREQLEADDFLTTIEEMTMRERYYTPEQLQQLEQRRHELGEDAIEDVEREWAEIFATLKQEMDKGTDPADPRLRPIGDRSRELLLMFTGGDPGIESSLKRMYETEGPEKASRGMADPAVFDYLAKVRAAAHSAR
jgi:MerR family transcriptional regulator, thiopeptide resistance regulator